VTLLNLALSIFPIVEVKSQASFALKVGTVTVIANIVGAALFWVAEKRRRSRSESAVAFNA